MKITVDRISSENDLVFTIKVSEPHHACFGELEKTMMAMLDCCKDGVSGLTTEENKTKNDVMGLIHAAKEKTFVRVLDSLKFAIQNELAPMFKPICQEIYNWIHDQQSGDLKAWMIEFDPQRTKYYFNNDQTAQKILIAQESEHENEDDEDEDED